MCPALNLSINYPQQRSHNYYELMDVSDVLKKYILFEIYNALKIITNQS